MPAFAIRILRRRRFVEKTIFLLRCEDGGLSGQLSGFGPVANAACCDIGFARGLAALLRLAAIDTAGETIDQPHVLVGRRLKPDIAGGQPRDQGRQQDRHRDHRRADVDGHGAQGHGPIRRATAIELVITRPRHWMELGSLRCAYGRLHPRRPSGRKIVRGQAIARRLCDNRSAQVSPSEPGPGPERHLGAAVLSDADHDMTATARTLAGQRATTLFTR